MFPIQNFKKYNEHSTQMVNSGLIIDFSFVSEDADGHVFLPVYDEDGEFLFNMNSYWLAVFSYLTREEILEEYRPDILRREKEEVLPCPYCDFEFFIEVGGCGELVCGKCGKKFSFSFEEESVVLEELE